MNKRIKKKVAKRKEMYIKPKWVASNPDDLIKDLELMKKKGLEDKGYFNEPQKKRKMKNE